MENQALADCSKAFSVLFLSPFQKFGVNEIDSSNQEQVRQGAEQGRTLSAKTHRTHILPSRDSSKPATSHRAI